MHASWQPHSGPAFVARCRPRAGEAARRRPQARAAAWLLLLLVVLVADPLAMPWVERLHGVLGPEPRALHELIRYVVALYGGGATVAVGAALIYAFDRRPARALALVLIVLAVSVTNYSVKLLTGRLRPLGAEQTLGGFRTSFAGPLAAVGHAGRQSFPSGHTAAAVSQSVVLASFYPAAAPVFCGLAIVVGLARIYYEAHFPSDVLAGALLAYAMSRWLLASPRFGRLCERLASRRRRRSATPDARRAGRA